MTTEYLKQQESIITTEELNKQLLKLNKARTILKENGHTFFNTIGFKEERIFENQESYTRYNRTTRVSNNDTETLESRLSKRSPFRNLSIHTIDQELISSIFVSHGFLAIHLGGVLDENSGMKTINHIVNETSTIYPQVLLDITEIFPIYSKSISLLINILRSLDRDPMSIAIVTSEESRELVSSYLPSDFKNILSNYQEATKILKRKTQETNHDWYGLIHSGAMFTFNELISSRNVKIKGRLSDSDYSSLKEFTNSRDIVKML